MMGLGLGKAFLSSSCDCKPTPPNPDPGNFRVRREERYGPYLLVEAHYPGVTTFEGNKLLVFQDENPDTVVAGWASLDPHFSQRGRLLARFVPTPEGLGMARAFCDLLVRDMTLSPPKNKWFVR